MSERFQNTIFTPEQNRIAYAFLDKHCPGQLPGMQWLPAAREHPAYLGVDSFRATHLIATLTYNVFYDNPQISEEEFRNEMLKRFSAWHNLSQRLDKVLKKHGLQESALYSTNHFLQYAGNPKGASVFSGKNAMPEERRLKSFALNLRFASKWLATKPMRTKDFTITPVHYAHPESLLSLQVTDKSGRTVATVGGNLYYDEKGKVAVRITNVQGGKRKVRETKKAQSRRYEKLSQQLGGNWRAHFLRQLKKIAAKRGMTIVGDLPEQYYASDEEFERFRTRYERGYKRAGLKPSEDRKTWHFTPKK